MPGFDLFCLVPKSSQTNDSSQPRPVLGWMPVVVLSFSLCRAVLAWLTPLGTEQRGYSCLSQENVTTLHPWQIRAQILVLTQPHAPSVMLDQLAPALRRFPHL